MNYSRNLPIFKVFEADDKYKKDINYYLFHGVIMIIIPVIIIWCFLLLTRYEKINNFWNFLDVLVENGNTTVIDLIFMIPIVLYIILIPLIKLKFQDKFLNKYPEGQVEQMKISSPEKYKQENEDFMSKKVDIKSALIIGGILLSPVVYMFIEILEARRVFS